MVFAGAGYKVSLYDVDAGQVEKALQGIKDTLKQYEEKGCLRGTLSADDQSSLVTGCSDLAHCIEGAKHVQVRIGSDLQVTE